ncbi:MAG: hypothetical protein KGP27_00245 [Hyphomicrobiales bacterium]|nr:hypothetical protein [Hyphomicrobiales bacterium]
MTRFLERHAVAALYVLAGLAVIFGLIVLDILRVFPEDAEPQAVKLLRKLLEVVKDNAEAFERATKFLGVLATLLGAVVSVFVGIRYAQNQLPARFVELMANDAKMLDIQRQRARTLIDHQRVDLVTRGTTLYVGPLNAALKNLSLGNHVVATQALADARFDIEIKIEVVQKRLEGLRAQAATVAVLNGIVELCHRAPTPDSYPAKHDRRLRAEACFSYALEFDRNDADALELRAETRLHLKREHDARADFQRLIRMELDDGEQASSIEGTRLVLIQARAHRRLAELEMERARRDGVQVAYQDAREFVDDGVHLLEQDTSNRSIEHIVELARLHLTAAEIFRRRRPQQPQNLIDAKTAGLQAITDLDDPAAIELRAKLEAIRLDA